MFLHRVERPAFLIRQVGKLVPLEAVLLVVLDVLAVVLRAHHVLPSLQNARLYRMGVTVVTWIQGTNRGEPSPSSSPTSRGRPRSARRSTRRPCAASWSGT